MPPSEKLKLRSVSPRPDFKANYLEFANAPAIVRANQKDSYFETVLRDKLQNVIQIFKGQRFTHTHPEEIGVAAKALYLALTTLLGTKTLGEEYVDLIYVSRDGKRIPKYFSRAGFVFSYAILPYLLTRLFRRLKSSSSPTDEVTDEKINSELPISLRIERYLANMSYTKVLDTIMNLHIAVFYFSGQFYNISKRFFSMRYAFGHKINKDLTPNGNYELLGGLIVLQMVMKSLGGFKGLLGAFTGNDDHDDNNLRASNKDIMYGIPSEEEQEEEREQLGTIDLSDPTQLPYIPEASRQCMLCLSYMTNPTAANCGHCFCWGCIIDWCKERPECPLCRQKVLEQQLLPLH